MEPSLYLKAIGALIFVIALIGMCSIVFKRVMLGKFGLPDMGQKRLKIVEMTAIDTKHRLVLVRRDDTEHLLLVGNGQGTNMVVETAITPPIEQDKTT